MHLYLHIPFCRQACHYCDFHFSTSLKQKSEIVNALCKEIALQRHYLKNNHLKTIYFGGGTPSLLSEAELQQIFDCIYTHFEIEANAEITLEANPDDLNAAQIKLFKQMGINRLSIGLQSFNQKHLDFLNRIHTNTEAETCIKISQDLGIENISVDLIYGIALPNTDAIDNWAMDLAQATTLGVPHISAYCLTIEPQTVFGNWLKKKKMLPINQDLSAQHFEMLLAHLSQNDYEQYEVSNFCKAKAHSRHNSSYWQHEAYLGIGPSAHSFNGQSLRQYNVANNQKYLQAIAQGNIPCSFDELSKEDQLNEYLLIGLRTKWGSNLGKIAGLGFPDFREEKADLLLQFEQIGWLLKSNDTLVLTQKGKLFADKIAADLFV